MGKIEVFIGPMFSGKTTALIKRAKELEGKGKKIKVFKPAADNRYGEEVICTHDESELKAYNAKSIEEIKADTDVIIIDEFHFFTSKLVDYCKKWKNEGKHVIIAGLNLNYLGEPISFIDLEKGVEDLKEIADEIHLLKAKCAVCGKEADMTEMTVEANNTHLVGGAEKYRPVCREHHPRWRR